MVVQLLLTYSYLILFLGVVVEGEIFPLAAGFLSSLDLMNLYGAIGVTFVGAFVGDVLWFWVAWRWGRRLIDRWGRFFFLKPERLQWLENHFQRSGKTTLFITKFIYSFGHSSIIVAGVAHMNIREFIKVDLPASFLWACLFVLLGRVFGESFYLLRGLLEDVALAAGIILVGAVIFHLYLRKKLTRQV